MATKKKMLQAAAGSAAGGGFTAIEDVFSTYLYTGNSSTQTITNGIDLAGEGGLVWMKTRSSVFSHRLLDTEVGLTKARATDAADADLTYNPSFPWIASFNADGFTLGDNAQTNFSGTAYASWTFRKAPRFFDVVTYTGTGANRTIAHDLGVVPGCIIVKRTDTTGDWQVYHRGNTAAPETDYLVLNSTAATVDDNTRWNDTLPTSTVFSLGTATTLNASGGTYVAYLFAHDPLGPSGDGSDGLIACGGFTTDGSGRATVNLGWEPQFVIWKPVSRTGNWEMNDQMRGWNEVEGKYLFPDTTAAEGTRNNVSTPWKPTATGIVFDFSVLGGALANTSYIYIAIRRGPMREPTVGTEVFAVVSQTPNANLTGTKVTSQAGVVDAVITTQRSHSGLPSTAVVDRMRGGNTLLATNSTAADNVRPTYFWYLDHNDGLIDNFAYPSGSVTTNMIYWMFRRAPGFFDVVAYTGDGAAGRTVPHNLGVAPELAIFKNRTTAGYNWVVKAPAFWGTNQYLVLEGINTTLSNNDYIASATSSEITLTGAAGDWNRSGNAHVTYLFASLPGISKVGSYTGNGSSQTINCAFTTGARFVLIKRTDSTGDWYVWDTARGIVTGNDPFLELNTTDAEVTSDDSIDPDSSGFIVNQTATTNVNVSSASYIYFAVS